MATLNKQIWTNHLMKNFYPDTSFLKYSEDFTNLVDYDKLHMAEVGIDPEVFINNTTYPIPVRNRVDIPLEITLDLFQTENDLIRDPEVIEYAYDKLDSVLYSHKQTLRTVTGQKAAHAYAPQEEGEFNPIVTTTGADNGNGYRKMVPKDLVTLKKAYDRARIPLDDRFIVLDPEHVGDLMEFDFNAFKEITDLKNGTLQRIAGFNVLEFSENPRYNATTKQKLAWGAVNGAPSSFAFHKKEVMRADGSLVMHEEKSAQLRGTIVGFDKRFIALPIRNKAQGAIISALSS
jgi:hypothetical protein